MQGSNSKILVVNAGSSSIKICCYNVDDLGVQFSGEINNIGVSSNKLTVHHKKETKEYSIQTESIDSTIRSLTDWLAGQDWFHSVIAIGHRIVHGMQYTHPQVITSQLMNELKDITAYDPDHLTLESGIVHSFAKRFSDKDQIACFDTYFHATIPRMAAAFAIPLKYYRNGVKRYGFHGISYAYLMEVLNDRYAQRDTSRVILAHLGNGASVAAVLDGQCIDTSMGFTPAGGIVMSSRSGDLDPGVAWFMMHEGMKPDAFNKLINKQSGLLGLSEKSGDMKQLLEHYDDDEQSRLAVDVFCYQLKKFIGGYIAALGGLDVLVFSGGIGEHAPHIRKKVCEGLDYAGIKLDNQRNKNGDEVISVSDQRVKVLVLHTDEEIMIAKEIVQILKKKNS